MKKIIIIIIATGCFLAMLVVCGKLMVDSYHEEMNEYKPDPQPSLYKWFIDDFFNTELC